MSSKGNEGFVPEDGMGNDQPGYEPDENAGSIDTDFDLESEYKPAPLIPNGTYNASVTDVKLDTDQQCIIFKYTFSENGGLMSDGETQIDGNTIEQRVWMPKPGDENEYTSKGNMTKRQAKINMMMDFARKIKIEMNKPIEIISHIRNSDWLGLAVKVKIASSEYEGRVRNEVKEAKAV